MPTSSQRRRGSSREASTRVSTRASSRNHNTVPAPTLHANGAAEIAFQVNRTLFIFNYFTWSSDLCCSHTHRFTCRRGGAHSTDANECK